VGGDVVDSVFVEAEDVGICLTVDERCYVTANV
jgi:hypothetical protein